METTSDGTGDGSHQRLAAVCQSGVFEPRGGPLSVTSRSPVWSDDEGRTPRTPHGRSDEHLLAPDFLESPVAFGEGTAGQFSRAENSLSDAFSAAESSCST
ncbi:hypothetical protein ANANG_G00095950 [Anguilla anguilla]|uniref:Uncharacterized protein n=1 Tax=Anguilla anguilla TaxID=7936 RepID=A0A9D3S0N2_ANGAN|nr:hypothetical protein ANANG_G00095950 [Anguilla anguilla]